MKQFLLVRIIFVIISMTFLVACSSSSDENQTHLVFVVSPDLTYQTAGDVQPDTANLTSQGLNRSLKMATYLKEKILYSQHVKAIYALSPMTHLQTVNKYPNMTAIGYIQQFALLNKSTSNDYTANSFPIHTSYAEGSIPAGVSVPPRMAIETVGLDFNNTNNNNYALVSKIITSNKPGYYIFSAPWETISILMKNINTENKYGLAIPTQYKGSNYVYTLSITEFGNAIFKTYDAKLNPDTLYPQLPSPIVYADCTNPHLAQPETTFVRNNGENGVVTPSNANRNQTIYIVRHAEAHPDSLFHFENGNYVGAGQWRALELSNVLAGKINHPDMVYSIDPAQWTYLSAALTESISYVRPSLTVLPYVIANNLPYKLVSEFQLMTKSDSNDTAKSTSNFFFTGGTFSDKTILLAWESGHVRPFLNYLLDSYGGTDTQRLNIDKETNYGWPGGDYNTIWRVTLDTNGNLRIDNSLCEGIDSAQLPAEAPKF